MEDPYECRNLKHYRSGIVDALGKEEVFDK